MKITIVTQFIKSWMIYEIKWEAKPIAYLTFNNK